MDQKNNRAAIHRFCKDKKVLDCFTHTGLCFEREESPERRVFWVWMLPNWLWIRQQKMRS